MESLRKKLIKFTNEGYCTIALLICILLSTAIALTEGLMKMFGFETSVQLFGSSATLDVVLKNAKIIFIYLAANALVGLLIELRSRLKTVEKETPKSFINLNEASDSIKNIIKNAAFSNRTYPLVIKVYGRRHRQNMDIIKAALNGIKANKAHPRKVEIYLYYSNPDFLESLKSFNADFSFKKMIDEQKGETEGSMKTTLSEIDAKRYFFVELKIRKHFDTPQFWAIQIDRNDVFWGYFKRTIDDGSQYIQGTPHECFHFDSGSAELDGFSNWIDNIFERVEEWSMKVN